MSKVKRAMWAAMACLSLVACSKKEEGSGNAAEAAQGASGRLEEALSRFGSTRAELDRFLETGDDAWLKRVRELSQQNYTRAHDIIALRQITSYMAQQAAPPERFLQVCIETDLLVIYNEEYIYPYDQWHTAVCARGVSQEEKSK